jgi:hypothetical protein
MGAKRVRSLELIPKKPPNYGAKSEKPPLFSKLKKIPELCWLLQYALMLEIIRANDNSDMWSLLSGMMWHRVTAQDRQMKG